MVVIIGVFELWPLLIACLADNVEQLIKMRVDEPMVVVWSTACMDVFEGRKDER